MFLNIFDRMAELGVRCVVRISGGDGDGGNRSKRGEEDDEGKLPRK